MGTEIGVPQGSSVSNIIFSLLMNDLPDSIPDAHVTMYADDVAATVTGSSVEDLEERLCVVAGQLAKWFRINGLALNPKKTHLLHFNLAGRRGRPLQVILENETLSQVNETCFLGFRLDSGLFWDAHIDWLCGRLGGACFALSRLAATVPSEVVRSCYFATIQSLLTYGIELWGRAADWHRVFVMQKRAVRADSSHRTRVALFVRKNLQLYKQSQRARRAGQLLAVQHRLARCAQSVHVCGPEVYNALPTEIKDAPSLPAFKQYLKRWLVQHAFYTCVASHSSHSSSVPTATANMSKLTLALLVLCACVAVSPVSCPTAGQRPPYKLTTVPDHVLPSAIEAKTCRGRPAISAWVFRVADVHHWAPTR
ncbi:unnamed protein product [Plutella xylostella]|uniref:(diamondback moth) hypothetical protein n=1 Tax=Plutella xylostella TaxID=51655 RepID=A0A8S4EFN9_PLUXY|nr:unnamed protein product [Plutella xylostella]